jgi:hypothetical protein
MEYKPEVIAKTVDFWSPRFGRTINTDEATKLMDDVIQLFQILDEAARRIDDGTGVKI